MLHVVVGILTNQHSEVLITQRGKESHLAGMWEFPGGKLEAGETRIEALSRELKEELGIIVSVAKPLIQVRHHYSDRDVLLDVWKINKYLKQAYGREQQPLKWVGSDELHAFNLPAANAPILKAISLPEYYVILDADNKSSDELHKQIINNADLQYSLFVLRGKVIDLNRYADLAKGLIQLSRQLRVRLLLNTTVEQVDHLGAAGLHLSAQAASILNIRPMESNRVIGVSCHNANELKKAQQLDADFALLSPVNFTQSHPDSKPLGWNQFSRLVDDVKIPVYALGGLGVSDLTIAKQRGAQGLAGISTFQ